MFIPACNWEGVAVLFSPRLPPVFLLVLAPTWCSQGWAGKITMRSSQGDTLGQLGFIGHFLLDCLYNAIDWSDFHFGHPKLGGQILLPDVTPSDVVGV